VGKPVQTIPAQDQQDYLHAVACLRSHGITNFPDPVFSGGSVHFTIPPSINTHSTQFKQAQQICEKLIPAGTERLLERVWDEHTDPFTNTVLVTISRLRRKLGNPPIIETVPGVGYRITPNPVTRRRRD
jgi:hypothetical protein